MTRKSNQKARLRNTIKISSNRGHRKFRSGLSNFKSPSKMTIYALVIVKKSVFQFIFKCGEISSVAVAFHRILKWLKVIAFHRFRWCWKLWMIENYHSLLVEMLLAFVHSSLESCARSCFAVNEVFFRMPLSDYTFNCSSNNLSCCYCRSANNLSCSRSLYLSFFKNLARVLCLLCAASIVN